MNHDLVERLVHQYELLSAEERMEFLRRVLQPSTAKGAPVSATESAGRNLSAEAKQNISLKTKERWAEYRKNKAQTKMGRPVGSIEIGIRYPPGEFTVNEAVALNSTVKPITVRSRMNRDVKLGTLNVVGHREPQDGAGRPSLVYTVAKG